MHLTLCILLFATLVPSCIAHDEEVHLTILHTSDVTASFEQFDIEGDACSEAEDIDGECLGGIPRRGTVIKEVRNERDDINVLLLDGGDAFVGEWFNVYKGEATSYFMNKLGYDAMTFGNLEFALGPDGLALFLEDIDFDAVSTNLNVTNEAALQGLVKKSAVKMFGDEAVGIVGYAVQRTNEIAIVGDAYFEDVVQSIQAEVDSLTAQGINKIIVLGHSYGSVREGNEALEIARNIEGVDIVVLGGALLFQFADNGCPYIEADRIGSYRAEPYPIVVTPNHDPDGKVLLVHGYIDGRYLGRLNVVFDHKGRVSEWYGKPIRLDNNVEQDPELLAKIKEYAEGVANAVNRYLGRTAVKLQGGPRGQLICRQTECNMGNLITDAMIWKYVTSFNDDQWNDVSIAVMNGGGVRASIERGDIRFKDIAAVLPFSNTFDALEIEGRYIREMLEHAISRYDADSGAFLQMSGMRVTYDVTREPYSNRVIDVMVQCTECRIPQFVPLEDDKAYKIVVPSFVGGGGDGFGMVKDNAMNYVTGETGDEIVAAYIERFSPIFTGLDGRIKFVDLEEPTSPIASEQPLPSTMAAPVPGEGTPSAPNEDSTEDLPMQPTDISA